MGDLASKSDNRSTNTTYNQQVALQGTGQVGISGSSLINSPVTVYDADSQAVQTATELTHLALEHMSRTTDQAAVIALGAGKVVSEAVRENAGVANHGLDIANAIGHASHETVIYALDALQAAQDRALRSVDSAVASAQQTALLATPQSPAAYSEILGEQSGLLSRNVLIASGVGLGLIVLAYFAKK